MTISFVVPLNMEIRTAAERDIALNVVQKLSGALEDSPEESRLLMLIEAIEAWDNKHNPHDGTKQGPVAWIPSLASRD
jgi:hypothetical protein